MHIEPGYIASAKIMLANASSAWAAWASTYLAVVVFEPMFTYATLRLLKQHQHRRWVELCFAVKPLRLAS